MELDLRELLTAGHVAVIALGLLLTTVALVQGIRISTDEGVFPAGSATQQDTARHPPIHRDRVHEALHTNSSAPSAGRTPVRGGEGEA